jgi:hypothetical protein
MCILNLLYGIPAFAGMTGEDDLLYGIPAFAGMTGEDDLLYGIPAFAGMTGEDEFTVWDSCIRRNDGGFSF